MTKINGEMALQQPMIEAFREEIEKQIDLPHMMQTAQNFQVVSEDHARNALSMALQARKIEQGIETSREKVIRPHLDFQRAVNKIVKDVQRRLHDIESHLTIKLTDWFERQQDNPFTKIDEIAVEDGKLWFSEKWGYEVLECDKIPRAYLKVDDDTIDEAIKGGVRHIPGVRIFKYATTQLRVKNQRNFYE